MKVSWGYLSQYTQISIGHIRTAHFHLFQKIGPSPVDTNGRSVAAPSPLPHPGQQNPWDRFGQGEGHVFCCNRWAWCWLFSHLENIANSSHHKTMCKTNALVSMFKRRFKYYAQLPVVTPSWPIFGLRYSTRTKDFSWAGHDAASFMAQNLTNYQTESVGPSSKCYFQFWKAIGVVLFGFVVFCFNIMPYFPVISFVFLTFTVHINCDKVFSLMCSTIHFTLMWVKHW